jgi:hypothetical protein
MRISATYVFWIIASCVLVLAGCNSTRPATQTGPVQVGPGQYTPLGSQTKEYDYRSDIYLDVAIPVFDPGFPLRDDGQIDDEAVAEAGIWPQVRRTEAKRFAIDTQAALSETKAFGKINVTPTANTNADVFVLGRIDQSDTEFVQLTISVIAATGQLLDARSFKHEVSSGFYRDAMNRNKDPYGPVFAQVAQFVFDTINNLEDSARQAIKDVAMVRYAAVYSPERFGPYLNVSQNRSGTYEYSLNGLPAIDDPMLMRINAIKAQEMMFVDNLQDNFAVFQAQTHDAYRTYQKETLPIVKRIRKEEAKRTGSQLAAIGLTVAAVLLNKNSNSTAGQVGSAIAGIAAVSTLNDAVQSNRQIARHRELFEEMGENLDIELSPQVMEFNDQEIELVGTAGEQYQQWKAYLQEIYALEATPDTAL